MSVLLVLVACSAVWLGYAMFAAPRFPRRAVCSRPTSHPSQGWRGTIAYHAVTVLVLSPVALAGALIGAQL